ncbi:MULTISPECIES: ABC transporter ATP-binding protein [Nostoc]|uniref:ABC transporter ATP-binding protein n=1 Tax=Nostoc paludosum FACHB-159 TaxID=2692908 RepID=A0ABR8K2S3_9NOSO|nr:MULTISPECIES: ABC transporter ATP-binding protein [Nostoc]MBD2677132.1 ABC transporter ATP-binding protein [Nostoc sp. FACHB-857]MBD2733059.1 ABC transporter ATP-binding protein [Nostoc paludosum FACHB-159]
MNKSVSRLEVRNISKSYSGFVANHQVNLAIQPGEIHGLLGENGAGKSTLMKIIYGLVRPDAGEIFWEGRQVNINSPESAISLLIGMVFQHFNLFETLTVTENIALTLPRSEKWDLSRVAKKIITLSAAYELNIDCDRPVHTLSVGEKQRLEILRCLYHRAKLLILDEPTAVLTPQETETLFATLRQIASDGCSILFSSHKLLEMQSLCNHATVLRQGQVVANCNPKAETPANLVRMMIGADLQGTGEEDGEMGGDSASSSDSHLIAGTKRKHQPPGPVCLLVKDLHFKPQNPFGTTLHNINMEIHTGEIVGIAGVAGNGQTELLSALSGEIISPQAEMIMLGEMPIGKSNVTQRRRLGLGYVPEERLEKSVVPSLSLLENALLTAHGQGLLRRGMIRFGKLKTWTQRICDAFNVNQAGVNSVAATLSGGNLQKFIMGREISQNPAVLIAAHPSWGVDVQATARIHEALIEMRDTGAAVLIISEDLDELFALCDRIGAIYKGQVSPLKAIAHTNRDEIGSWMGGLGFN